MTALLVVVGEGGLVSSGSLKSQYSCNFPQTPDLGFTSHTTGLMPMLQSFGRHL